jgi:hypothetical protein
MSQQSQEERPQAARAGDRRANDRRRFDRRAPAPLWRRWWALVGYGVVGALALVMLLNALTGGRDAADPRDEVLVERTGEGSTTVAPANPAATAAAPEDA